MRKQFTLFVIAVMLISFTLPLVSIVRGSGSYEEEPTDFQDVTIKTDPAIPPSGEMEPGTDENVEVTVETSKTIDEASLNVSAIKWNGDPVRGLEPSEPARWEFDISDDGYSAISLLNNIKYFPPGTEVTWNVYLLNYADQSTYTSENFTYEVKGAWEYNSSEAVENGYENAFQANIDMDISPEIPPNAYDPVDITLQSSYDGVEIGEAILEIHYENETVDEEGSLPFRNVDPIKGIEEVTVPGLPAGTEVEFTISAWDDPEDTRREIKSETYNYTVKWGNTWESSIFEDNVGLATDPEEVTEEDSIVGIGNSVNITIESKDTEVPIKTAIIEYEIGGRGIETQEGQDRFNEISSTKWYYKIPGQPPGLEITFRVKAYDIMKRDIVSQDYNYVVAEKERDPKEAMTFFYVTVFDGDKNEYVSDVDVTIKNETWIWEGKTNPSGFAYPTKMNSLEPKYLHYGTYNITVEYDGMTKNTKYELSPQSDDTVEVEFNPTEEKEYTYASPVENPPYYLIGLTVTAGLAGAVGYLLYHLRKDVNKQSGLAEGG